MTTDIVYAIALILEQLDAGTFTLVTEPIKMVLDECLKAAVGVNLDTTHPYIMTCTPFVEQGLAS